MNCFLNGAGSSIKNPNRVGDFLSHPLCLFLIVPIKDVIS